MRTRAIPYTASHAPVVTTSGLRPHRIRTAALLVAIIGLLVAWLSGNQTNVRTWPVRLLPTSELSTIATPPPIVATFAPAQPVPAHGANGGAREPAPSPELEIRAAIDGANRAFRTARAQASLAPLSGIATGAWMRYEQSYIADLQGRGATEQWNQLSLAVTGTTVRDTAAVACTVERWERSVVSADGSSGPPAVVEFVERYILVRQGGGWQVSEIQYPEQGCVAEPV